jgi:glutaredoxin 2
MLMAYCRITFQKNTLLADDLKDKEGKVTVQKRIPCITKEDCYCYGESWSRKVSSSFTI